METYSQYATEPVLVGDISGISDDKPLMPPSANVLVRVKEAKMVGKEPNKWKGILVNLVVEEGIADELEGKIKFRGFHISALLCVFANANEYQGSYADKIRSNKHLVDLRYFTEAIGLDSKNVIINDAFIADLVGKQLLVNIGQKKDGDGMVNTAFKFRSVPEDLSV